MENILSTDQN